MIYLTYVTSVLLFAAGAIIRFAFSSGSGFNAHLTGIILMILGIAGYILAFILWGTWSPWSSGRARERSLRMSTVPQRSERRDDSTRV
jgi:hypothetical protein